MTLESSRPCPFQDLQGRILNRQHLPGKSAFSINTVEFPALLNNPLCLAAELC